MRYGTVVFTERGLARIRSAAVAHTARRKVARRDGMTSMLALLSAFHALAQPRFSPRRSQGRRRGDGQGVRAASHELSRRRFRRSDVVVVAAAAASASAPAADERPLPPYAALSVPVYSLATVPDDGDTAADSAPRPSMNITTYCCPVTINPTRRMAVALYAHTATARNVLATGKAVLQVLREQHAPLVPLLGKSSAHDVDKLAEVRALGFAVEERFGVPTLADAAGVIALELVSMETAGDHHLALCEVVGYETLEGTGEPLYTADLPDGPGVKKKETEKSNNGDNARKKRVTRKKQTRDPNAPKRPLSSYMIFSSETRGKVLEETPGLSVADVGKALGARWKSLSPEDKAVFEAKVGREAPTAAVARCRAAERDEKKTKQKKTCFHSSSNQ